MTSKAELVALLREVEWSGNAGGTECPVCEARPRDGRHLDDCRLDAALREESGLTPSEAATRDFEVGITTLGLEERIGKERIERAWRVMRAQLRAGTHPMPDDFDEFTADVLTIDAALEQQA